MNKLYIGSRFVLKGEEWTVVGVAGDMRPMNQPWKPWDYKCKNYKTGESRGFSLIELEGAVMLELNAPVATSESRTESTL